MTASVIASDPFLEGCWRCGEDATVDSKGWQLCGPCRRGVIGAAVPGAMRGSSLVYWDSHALEWCWRCMGQVVSRTDELGLCGDCKAALVTAGAP